MVRTVLADAAKKGLPGEHHFKITFATPAPGVRLSDRMRAQYPEAMTIVLQHQFWDLVVTDEAFEVGLSFGGVPERLAVPFDAITAFYDPAVQFGFQFETVDAAAAEPSAPVAAVNPAEKPAAPASKSRAPAETKSDRLPAPGADQPAPAPGAEEAVVAAAVAKSCALIGSGRSDRHVSGRSAARRDALQNRTFTNAEFERSRISDAPRPGTQIEMPVLSA